MVDHPNKKTITDIKIDIAWKRRVFFLTIPLEGVFSHTVKIEDMHRCCNRDGRQRRAPRSHRGLEISESCGQVVVGIRAVTSYKNTILQPSLPPNKTQINKRNSALAGDFSDFPTKKRHSDATPIQGIIPLKRDVLCIFYHPKHVWVFVLGGHRWVPHDKSMAGTSPR